MTTLKNICSCICCSFLCLFVEGCYKDNSASGFLSENAGYLYNHQYANVGKGLWIGSPILPDGSNLPITCSITAIRDANGQPANYTQKMIKTRHWKSQLTDEEKDPNEVMEKYKLVTRPSLDIDPRNGRLIIYPEADTADIPSGTYYVDVKMSNEAGERTIKNAVTLNVKTFPFYAWEKYQTNDRYVSGSAFSDYTVEFVRIGNGNSLTVKYMSPDGKPVDPALIGYNRANKHISFQQMDGINPYNYKRLSDRQIMQVMYPIPFPIGEGLQEICIETYDNNYDYFAFRFGFAIYKQGDWEMTIRFIGKPDKFWFFFNNVRKAD